MFPFISRHWCKKKFRISSRKHRKQSKYRQDYIKARGFFRAHETTNRVKRKPTQQKKILIIYLLDKEYPEFIKNSKTSILKTHLTLNKKYKQAPKNLQTNKKPKEPCSTLLANREIQM